MPEPIRVLVVDDSEFARDLITELLQVDPEVKVIATASSGGEAVELTQKLRPDLVTMDLLMEPMDGLEATRRIMATTPTSILVVTAAVGPKGPYTALDALSAGALDVLEKPVPRPGSTWEAIGEQLLRRVHVLARARPAGRPVVAEAAAEAPTPAPTAPATAVQVPREEVAAAPPVGVVGIVSSTGGPSALRQMLSRLPPDFALGTMVVQHMAAGFTEGLVGWLGSECAVQVRVAQQGERLQRGAVFVAPEQLHTQVALRPGQARGAPREWQIHLLMGAPLGGYLPSGDLLLESVAGVCGARSAGVVLSGTGRDGCMGLKAIKSAGGHTWVQDEATCAVFGMPQAALDQGAAEQALPPAELAERLLHLARELGT